MTAQLRTPELVLLVDPTEATGRRLVMRAEVAASFVRAVGQRSGSLTLAGLQVCEGDGLFNGTYYMEPEKRPKNC